jgi:TonB family protein
MRGFLQTYGDWGALGVALVAHLAAAYQIIPVSVPIASGLRQREAPVEVVSSRDLPVVQTQEAIVQSNEKSKAKFAGERTQRVKEETRAAIAGVFAPGQGSAPSEKPDPDGLEMQQLLLWGASPNKLPEDMRVSNETVLNTDAISYASFLNRIADEVYGLWTQNVREAADRLRSRGGDLQSKLYITKLRIELDNAGRVNAIRLLKSSGVDEIDEAPKKAFWEKSEFPNPPEQMRDAEGVIHFVYEFHFEWKNAFFNIVPRAI